MGTQPTGNGHPRILCPFTAAWMTNTYMLAGKSKFDDLVASVDLGILHRTLVAVKWILLPANLFSPPLKPILSKKVKLPNR